MLFDLINPVGNRRTDQKPLRVVMHCKMSFSVTDVLVKVSLTIGKVASQVWCGWIVELHADEELFGLAVSPNTKAAEFAGDYSPRYHFRPRIMRGQGKLDGGGNNACGDKNACCGQ